MTSQINPNNINGAYPVAGQDNNSQGFRDNFTNTGTNFAYAAAEITDLQNKVVLKSALTGGTLNNDMLGSILSSAQLQNMSGTVVSLGTVSGLAGVNYAAGPYQTVTLGGSTSLSFTNWTPAGTVDYVVVEVTVSSTAYTLTLPSAVGAGASAMAASGIQGLDVGTNVLTFAEVGTYLLAFSTADSGTTIYIMDLTRPRNVFMDPLSITANVPTANSSSGSLVVVGGAGISGDLYVGGAIYGNITGNLVVPGSNTQILFNGNGNACASPALTFNSSSNLFTVGGNVTVTNSLTANVNLSALGNVRGANILTGGYVSATGTVTGDGGLVTNGQITSQSDISAVGNVEGNFITSVTDMVAVGNVSAAYVNLTGSEELFSNAAIDLTVATSYFTTTAAETATLDNGADGQIKIIAAANVALGNMVVTVGNAGWSSSGNGNVTFSTQGSACTLQFVNGAWYCIGNNGAIFA